MILSQKQLEDARNYIRKCIAQTQAGGHLPSLRSMQAESHSSRVSIQKVINEFVASGYLMRKARSGYFLPPLLSNGRTIEVIACHDEGYLMSGFLHECLMALINCFSLYGYSVRVTSVYQNDSIEKYLEISKRSDVAAFVLLVPYAREIIFTFQLTGKPVLSLYSQGQFIGVDQVVSSSKLITLQMDHLMGLGHKWIMYLAEDYKQIKSSTENDRILNYYRIMAQHGLVVPLHWQTWYPYGKLEKTLELAFSKKPKPTALIVSDYAVQFTYDFLKKRNLRIGKDVSVVAKDDSLFLKNFSPTVSTTYVNHSEISEIAWRMLDKQFKGCKEFECREVEVNFRQGESSGRVTDLT